MKDQLDFSLPERRKQRPPGSLKWIVAINLTILMIVSGILFILILTIRTAKEPRPEKAGALSETHLKNLALKFEQQELHDSAVDAWLEYLKAADLKQEECARIWYRVGNLFQKEKKYEKALDAYYRSEQFARVEDFSSEISRRVQECLESLGKFAALRNELSSRVGIKDASTNDSIPSQRDAVLAEIGPQKITLSDLDHRIEQEIQRQFAMVAPDMSDEMKKRQKEALLKQFSTTDHRHRVLNEYLAEEILYREALASRLMEDPDIQAEIQNHQRAILVQKVIQNAYAELIKITRSDLVTYYEAHKEQYQNQKKSFDDVQNEIYAALRAQKEEEVSAYVLSQLRDKYDVVIHAAAMPTELKEKTDASKGINTGLQSR
jgi:hypothetical protein